MNNVNWSKRNPRSASDRGKSLKKSKSSPSLKKTWRMLLGLEASEPHFEFVDPESKLSTPPNEADTECTMGSFVDEEFGVLGKHLSKPAADASINDNSDGASSDSDGTLVDEPVIVRCSFIQRDLDSLYVTM